MGLTPSSRVEQNKLLSPTSFLAFQARWGRGTPQQTSCSVASRSLLAAPPFPPPPALNPTPVYLSPKCNAVGGWTAQRRPASHLRTFTQWRKGGTGAQPDVGRIVGGGDAESPCPLLRRINARRLRRIQLRATRQAVRRPGWSSLLLRPLPKESLHPNGRLTTRLPALGWNHFRVQPCALGLEASWWQPHPLGYRVMDPPTQQA